MSPDKKGVAVFGIAGKGDAGDLPKIAASFSDKLARKYGARPEQITGTTTGGLPAHAVVVTDASGGEATHLYFLWVVLRGTVYQLIGMGPGADRSQVKAMADSLRPLTAAERASITDLRLRIATARAGEDLPALSKRSQGALPTSTLAAMNGLPEDAWFKGGERIKLAVRSPHAAPR